MTKIDLHLCGTVFMDKGIYCQRLRISVVIHILYEIFKFGDSVDTIRKARHFATP